MDDRGVEMIVDRGVSVIVFTCGCLSDTNEISLVSDQIREFLNSDRPAKVVVDFSQVKFFSSQILGLLLEIRARQREYGGEVVISSIDPQLHRVFKITNLDTIFKFFADKEAAVEFFEKRII